MFPFDFRIQVVCLSSVHTSPHPSIHPFTHPVKIIEHILWTEQWRVPWRTTMLRNSQVSKKNRSNMVHCVKYHALKKQISMRLRKLGNSSYGKCRLNCLSSFVIFPHLPQPKAVYFSLLFSCGTFYLFLITAVPCLLQLSVYCLPCMPDPLMAETVLSSLSLPSIQ